MAGERLWYACVLELEALRDGVIPRTHGHQVHGLFLDLLRGVDPTLAARLHEGSARRPYTLSPLWGLPAARDGEGHVIAAGARVLVRLTLLDGAVFSGLLAAMMGEVRRGEVRLGSTPFRVERVATMPDQHRWAGVVRPAELLAGAGTGRTIALRFATPTAFSLGTRAGAGKVVEPLPRPELVFGGLLSAWNAASDVPLHRGLREVMAERLVIAGFDLRAAWHEFRDHAQVGVVGRCSYDMKGALPDETLRSINALADAAPFLGVGYRTTMGMGQVRRLEVQGSRGWVREHDQGSGTGGRT